jgi:N-methylhydantoinase A
VDLHTVGAGGGSLARVDAGGALRVGPESAGADPGPACYGRGDRPTVTDAQLVLGRLRSDAFLDGRMSLDLTAARRAVASLAGRQSVAVEALAADIVRVANANMERAVRVISVERGHDPRDFSLLAFGGAGPLHACDLAEALRIPRVIVPPHPGVLSAFGMAVADRTRDYVASVLQRLDPSAGAAAAVEARFLELAAAAAAELAEDGSAASARPQFRRSLDLRYAGQSYEVELAIDGFDPDEWARRFHAAHAQRYGHGHPGRPVEVVNARLRVGIAGQRLHLAAQAESAGVGAAQPRPTGQAEVWFGRPLPTAIVWRETLGDGAILSGPAIVVQMDTTTVINPGWLARVDAAGNLLLERA